MSNIRVSELSQVAGPIDRASQNLLIDDGENTKRMLLKQLFGSGAGAANRLTFREEITEITDEMWADIAAGNFDRVHAGMHYTAPSGRTYWFADADYFIQTGDTEQTAHHFVVIEDEINHTAQHQTTNITTGGAQASLIYTTTLPGYQSELEADFGADHILTQKVVLSNAVSAGVPSGWAWVEKAAMLLNACRVFGHNIGFSGAAGEMYNAGNRARQLALFQAMPEAIVARDVSTNARTTYWLDDVESSAFFGNVLSGGVLDGDYGASNVFGVRRAFLIG